MAPDLRGPEPFEARSAGWAGGENRLADAAAGEHPRQLARVGLHPADRVEADAAPGQYRVGRLEHRTEAEDAQRRAGAQRETSLKKVLSSPLAFSSW